MEEEKFEGKELKAYNQGFDVGYNHAIYKYERLKEDADGCEGCAFMSHYSWELPCSQCRRNCRDYWRSRKSVIEEGKHHGREEDKSHL